MDIITIQKNIPTSPRKLRLVADMVRQMTPVRAIETLRFTRKAAAGPLSKAIKTAMANAKQQNLAEDVLVFKSLEINGATIQKRFRAGSKGMADPYTRRTSHIKVVLVEQTTALSLQSSEKKETKVKEGGNS